MKRIFLLVAALMLMLSATAFAERGVIVFCNNRSGVIIIGTNMGYTCGTSYYVPFGVEQGNQVGGEFSSFGSHEIYDLTANTTFQLWIDEYWDSREQAIDWLQRQ